MMGRGCLDVRRVVVAGAVVIGSVGLLMAGCGDGSGGREPSDQVRDLRALEEASEDPLEVRFENGYPRFVWMNVPIPQDLADDDPVDRALHFLSEYSALYTDTNITEDLYLGRVITDENGGEHVFFRQRVNGLPIFGAELSVHMMDGRYRATLGRYAPDEEEDAPRVDARWDPEQARGVVLADVPSQAPQIRGEPRLTYLVGAILDEPDLGFRPAWEVHVQGARTSDGRFTSWQYFVDAATGEVLLAMDETRTHAPSKDYDIRTANNAVDGGSCFDGVTVDVQWFDENGALGGVSPDMDGQSAFNATDGMYDYLWNNFHRHSWDDADRQMRLFVHVDSGWRNAGWRGGCRHLVFGDGMATPDVVAHEHSHAVDGYTAQLIYLNQSGALDESYADVAGVMVDDDDWFIGEGSPRPSPCDSGVPAGVLRSLRDPTECGDPDHVSDYLVVEEDVDAGGVHTNSSIPNKAAYLIAAGGTHEDFEVAGMGRAKMGALLFNAHTTMLPRSATFQDARDAAVTVARLWASFGIRDFGPQDVCDVKNAYASVGIGVGDRDCDGEDDSMDLDDDGDYIPDAEDNCPGVPNPDQEDTDDSGVGDACDADDDDDGIADVDDNCPRVPNPDQLNLYGDDEMGDACGDADDDGVVDAEDNCPERFNEDQTDTNMDGEGDLCDTDNDGDGVLDGQDNCPLVENAVEQDGERVTGPDTDGDGAGDACDNCPAVVNPEQVDLDGDGQGDACDPDDDGDGVEDGTDNCQTVDNPFQVDVDGNGAGLLCDPAEAGMLDGGLDAVLEGSLTVDDPANGVRIPISPCVADGCPDHILPGLHTSVAVESSDPLTVQVVDDRGHVVAQSEPAVVGQGYVMGADFDVRSDFSYREDAGSDRFSDRSYFLEVRPAAGAQAPGTIPISLGVDTP